MGLGRGLFDCLYSDPYGHTRDRGWVGTGVGIRFYVMFILTCTHSGGPEARVWMESVFHFLFIGLHYSMP